MRICFLADPTHPNTSRWASHLATELGHDVWLLSGTPVERDTESNPRILPFPVKSKLGYLGLGFRVRAELKRLQPDLLIGYRIQSYGLAAALSGYQPLVLAAQTETIVWPPDNRIYRACVRYALRRAKMLQAWGPHMADRLEELGADRERILVLPRGVHVETFQPPARPVVDPVLIVTRALQPVYRHDLLFRAFARLLRSIPRAQLRVAGSGDEREKLERLAERLELGARVVFLGRLDEAALADQYRSARCYVTTVATEGVSASLLEAMGCGVVPVVADLPGNRDWIADGKNGLLLDRAALEEPERVAQSLHRALTDDDLQQRAFAENPLEIGRRADWNANMRSMESSYRRIAEVA